LFVSHKFPPSTGGMEKQCYELVTGFEKKCKVHRLIYEKKGNKFVFFLLLRRKIEKICINNPGINIIHFNDASIASLCSFMKIRENISYIVTLHGLDVVFPSAIYHKYIFTRLNRFTHFIAVSRATAERAVSIGLGSNKMIVVPNGVDTSVGEEKNTDEFNQWLSEKQIEPAGRKLLLLAGRAVERKGFSWFAENILPSIKKHFFLIIAGPFRFQPTFRERVFYMFPQNFRRKIMLFFGYASDERALRKIVRNSSDVVHLGRLSNSEISMLYRNVNAFLMPNIHIDGDMEGFGLVCLEASVRNTLVFASNIDGIPDAIKNEENGWLLPSGDIKAWIDQLNDFAENPTVYEKYQPVFGQFTRDNCNWGKMVDSYYNLFEKLETISMNVDNADNTDLRR